MPGLIVARLFLGAGEGAVYTAGSAWIVDLAPPERRGRIIGLYGLAIWGGLALGPADRRADPAGDELRDGLGVRGRGAAARSAGRAADPRALSTPRRTAAVERRLISREALRPGLGLSLAIVGYAAMAAFVVLHLDERGIGHGAAVFAAFAATRGRDAGRRRLAARPLRADPLRGRRRRSSRRPAC